MSDTPNGSSDNTNSMPAAPKKKSRWKSVLLIVSLALNLIVVGVIAGAAWGWRHGGWRDGRFPQFVAGRLLGDIAEPRRAEVMDIIERHLAAHRAKRKILREQRRKLGEILRTEPFDEQKIRTAALQLSDLHAQSRRQFADTMITILKKLTPTERQALLRKRFFRRLFARGPHRWRHRRWRD